MHIIKLYAHIYTSWDELYMASDLAPPDWGFQNHLSIRDCVSVRQEILLQGVSSPLFVPKLQLSKASPV